MLTVKATVTLIVNYDRNMFIVQATGLKFEIKSFLAMAAGAIRKYYLGWNGQIGQTLPPIAMEHQCKEKELTLTTRETFYLCH